MKGFPTGISVISIQPEEEKYRTVIMNPPFFIGNYQYWRTSDNKLWKSGKVGTYCVVRNKHNAIKDTNKYKDTYLL